MFSIDMAATTTITAANTTTTNITTAHTTAAKTNMDTTAAATATTTHAAASDAASDAKPMAAATTDVPSVAPFSSHDSDMGGNEHVSGGRGGGSGSRTVLVRVAVEADGPSHFTANTHEPLAVHAYR